MRLEVLNCYNYKIVTKHKVYKEERTKIMMKRKINKEIIMKQIEKNKNELKNNGVIKIGLFGSILKGKQTKKSDIDILIEFKNLSFDNYAEVIMLLEKMFKRKIDLITESSLRPEMAYVKKEAEYARL